MVHAQRRPPSPSQYAIPSMLIDFTVENFRSYREAKTFSLLASSSPEHPENLIEIAGLGKSAVKVAAIYGANASGKSNLLEAMNTLSELLIDPMRRSFLDEADIPPFALDEASSSKSTLFKVRFILQGQLFEYAIVCRFGLIEKEHLLAFPAGKLQKWFNRSAKKITTVRSRLGDSLDSLKQFASPSTPFLAVAATFNQPKLTPIAKWLGTNLRTHFDSQVMRNRRTRLTGSIEETSRLCATRPKFRAWVNAFLRYADLGILEIEISSREVKRTRQVMSKDPFGGVNSRNEEFTSEVLLPSFVHSGQDGFSAKLPITSESQGTQKLFSLLVPFYETLQSETGRLMIIDEYGQSMHPSLSREIVRMFHDTTRNVNGSQLIFTTHDISLLSAKLLRRDQVWFTEKDRAGATDLYSLHDFTEVEGESLEKGYLRGRYGAIPFFGSFDFPPARRDETSQVTAT